MRFDAERYIDVQERITRFWGEYPDGAIVTEMATPGSQFDQVVFRAEVYKERGDVRPSAVGYAAEERGDSKLAGANFTSWHENAECVPLAVPALTPYGWFRYDELEPGDLVMGYDPSSDTLDWTVVQKVTVYPKAPVVQIGNSRFTAIATPNHRWVTSDGIVPWNELPERKGLRTITIAAPLAKRGGDPVAAAKLGWLFTDGHVRYSRSGPSSGFLTQSKPEYVAVLEDLFGPPTMEPVPAGIREWGGSRGVSVTREAQRWYVPSSVVRPVLQEYSVTTEADLSAAVLRMTRDEAEAFLTAAMMADGSGGWFGKTKRDVVDAVQLAMFLTGHATSPITERTGNEMTTKPCYVVSQHNHGRKYLSEFREWALPPRAVWCPTTEAGTWVANFNGRLAITGNTSAIGRALANMGYATSREDRPSRQEMEKVNRAQEQPQRQQPPRDEMGGPPMTDNQRGFIISLAKDLGMVSDDGHHDAAALDAELRQFCGMTMETLTVGAASKVIEEFKARPKHTSEPEPIRNDRVDEARAQREADWLAAIDGAGSYDELQQVGTQIAAAGARTEALTAAWTKKAATFRRKA